MSNFFSFLMFLSLVTPIFAKGSEPFDMVLGVKPNDTLVKLDITVNKETVFGLYEQSVRVVDYNIYTDGQITKASDTLTTNPSFISPIFVDKGITESQANMAVDNPQTIISVPGAKEKLGGFGWLFPKKQGIVYDNCPEIDMKSICYTKENLGTDARPSWKMIIAVLLILAFSGLISLRIVKGGAKDPDNRFGEVTCQCFSVVAFISILFCLTIEALSWFSFHEAINDLWVILKSYASGFIFYCSLALTTIFLVFGPFSSKKKVAIAPRPNKAISMQLSILALVNLCYVIFLLAGWQAFLAYTVIALLIFGLFYFPPMIIRKIKGEQNK